MNEKMKRICLLAYFILLCPSILAQKDISLKEEISWTKINGQSTFDQANFSKEFLGLPMFSQLVPTDSPKNATVELVSATYESAETLSAEQIERIPEEISPQVSLRKSRNDYSLVVSILPYRKVGASIERLTSFELAIGTTNTAQLKTPTLDYTSQSLLSQGEFFKIEVAQDGIHKISRSLLADLGMNLDNLNIGDVRVFGLPGGMLPQAAGARVYDDLIEVAVEVVDQNANGSFDDEDYLLFYGEGADSWEFDETNSRFSFAKNFYTDFHYYFISRALGASKKIPSYTSSGTASNFSNSFDALYAHERDENMYLKSGRNWLGEIFQNGGTQSYDLSFPNLINTEPVYFETLVGGRTLTNGATNRFRWTLDGQTIVNISTSKVTDGYDQLYLSSKDEALELNINNDDFNLTMSYTNPGGNDGIGWLDYFILNARRSLSFENEALQNGQLIWRDKNAIGEDMITEFQLANTDNITLWDVSKIESIQKIEIGANGTFSIATEELKKFIAFNNQNHFVPKAIGKVEPQNLHEEVFYDYILITTAELKDEAERLADFHRQSTGLTAKVVDVEHLYLEFAAGARDITAIRDYIKMLYDRAAGSEELAPKYLCLLGDATYDYKNIHIEEASNSNMVPTYQSDESFDARFTYCTDDYYGFLDDGEGEDITDSGSGLDIAIGRMPVRSAEELRAMVDKVIHYKSDVSKGQWLNQLTFIADDEDGNLHLDDTEDHIAFIESAYPEYNIDKVYFDAFRQVPTANGNSFPDVNVAINNKIFSGSFLINYLGHGSENAWAHEGVLDIPTIKSWSNKDRMPLFVTATCSFSRYDDPKIVSAGEELVLNPKGGAIAIVTTVRLVYTNANKQMNRGFLNFLFEKDNGEEMAVGEILRRGKNSIAQTDNNRKFALLGDPALILNYPKYDVLTTEINNQTVGTATMDTLKALSKVTIKGEVRNEGNLITDFNGTVTPVVYDKLLTFQTLGQDEKSYVEDFTLRKSLVFKGLASVVNGQFQFSFVVPRDIAYQIGTGKLSYYAQDNLRDANGYNSDVLIGGVNENPAEDDEGPQIDIYINDESFVFGGTTTEDPVILLKMVDESGINTTGTGVGHDVSIKLDGAESDEIVVNDYYKAAVDNFQEGDVTYPLFSLEEGRHTISARAWDTYNNPGEGYTEFVVAKSAEMALNRVLNYPNPFTDYTSFWFEHNRVGQNLQVNIQIFSSSGRLIKTITKEVLSAQTRVDDIHWDGRDDFGNIIGRGVYVYRITLTSENGQNSAHAIEKLVILK